MIHNNWISVEDRAVKLREKPVSGMERIFKGMLLSEGEGM